MSNQVNEMIQEQILDDVLDLYKGDVWNVIRAIENEFGFDELRFINDDDGDDGFINKLVELRFDALCAWGG
jgi:hypothetical protein